MDSQLLTLKASFKVPESRGTRNYVATDVAGPCGEPSHLISAPHPLSRNRERPATSSFRKKVGISRKSFGASWSSRPWPWPPTVSVSVSGFFGARFVTPGGFLDQKKNDGDRNRFLVQMGQLWVWENDPKPVGSDLNEKNSAQLCSFTLKWLLPKPTKRFL